MMSTDVKTFCYNWALKPQVKLLGGFVDEQGGDGVHLQQVGPEVLEGSESKLTCGPCR